MFRWSQFRFSGERRPWAAAPALLCGLGFALSLMPGCKLLNRNPGPLIFVSNIMAATVTVIEPNTNKIRTIKVGALPHNIALSPDHRTVTVANTGSMSVSHFDAKTGDWVRNQLLGPIPSNKYHDALPKERFKGVGSCSECHGMHPVGPLTNGFTYTPDGQSAWVVAFAPPGLWRIDLATGKKVQELPLFTFKTPTQPSNVVFTPDGSQMIILHRARGKHVKVPKPNADKSALMGFNHGADDYSGNGSVTAFYSPDGKTELAHVQVPATMPYKATFSPDGLRMYVAYRSTNKVIEFDVKAHTVLRTLTVGEGPTNMVIDPTGEWMYVPSFYDLPPDVIKLELKTGKIRALLKEQPVPTTVGMDTDTGLLYTCINGTNRVIEQDPSGKGKTLRWFPTGAFPLDILVVPGSVRAKL